MVEIRRLPAIRWRDYRKLRLEALNRSPLAFGSTLREERGINEREWRKRMKGAYFALLEDKPVGMIECAFTSSVKFRHIAEIYSFYVTPDHRGHGIGVALLHYALNVIRRKGGIVKVRLYVNSKQRTAILMYKKNGFVATGRLMGEMRVGTRLYTMLIMEKVL
jgi:ribosomal protein S18 acetylase RimI-like enzyme